MSTPSIDRDSDAEMFDLAPVSLWLEDYSGVKALFQEWRAENVTDIKAFLTANPDRVRRCSERIRVLKVNPKTLSLYGARDLDHLMTNLGQVLRDDTFKSHVEELAQLWYGQTSFASNTVNYTLTGKRLDIQLWAGSFPATKNAGTASWCPSRT